MLSVREKGQKLIRIQLVVLKAFFVLFEEASLNVRRCNERRRSTCLAREKLHSQVEEYVDVKEYVAQLNDESINCNEIHTSFNHIRIK